MRLFLAVDLDESSRIAVAEIATALRARLDPTLIRGTTWVAPSNLHISLRFLGWVRDEAAAALYRAFEEPVQLAPFEIEIGGVGAFPGTGAPRVLWIGVRTGEALLSALYDEVHTRLTKLQVLPEARTLENPKLDALCQVSGLASERRGARPWPRSARPFHPHITLARFKPNRMPRRSRLPAWVRESGNRIGPMRVSEITLFESRLSPSGPTYVSKLRTPLVG
ncbi:MAG: RNA 2',3'-cyclic phosphodiesterase [Luteitalea sp.]|nr:RNA 2',3'-cyclic phosphodiesterase [Luteitalea sp.]